MVNHCWNLNHVNGRKLRSTKVIPVVNPKIPEMNYKVAYTWPIRFRPGATHRSAILISWHILATLVAISTPSTF